MLFADLGLTLQEILRQDIHFRTMRPSLDYIQHKFDEYNTLCFGGKLQPLPLRLSRARTYLGQVACKRRRTLRGTWHYYDFVFRISTLIDLPEREVEDTILHEMIHYYILSNQLQDSSTHGRLFTSMMREINRRFGRHITISHRKTKEEYEQDVQVRQHFICVVRLGSGSTGIIIAAKSRLNRIWNALPHISAITSAQWYLSHDPYFNRYPRSLSVKVYPIPPSELEEHLRDARMLIRQGNIIHVGGKTP